MTTSRPSTQLAIADRRSEIFLNYANVVAQLNAWFAGAAPQAGCLRQNVTLPAGPISISNDPAFQAVNAAINVALVAAIDQAA